MLTFYRWERFPWNAHQAPEECFFKKMRLFLLKRNSVHWQLKWPMLCFGTMEHVRVASPVQHHLNCNLWPTQNPHQKCNIRLDLELQFFFCTYLENCSIQLSFVFSLDQTRPRSDRDWWAGVDWLQRLRNLWWHQVGWENENCCIKQFRKKMLKAKFTNSWIHRMIVFLLRD